MAPMCLHVYCTSQHLTTQALPSHEWHPATACLTTLYLHLFFRPAFFHLCSSPHSFYFFNIFRFFFMSNSSTSLLRSPLPARYNVILCNSWMNSPAGITVWGMRTRRGSKGRLHVRAIWFLEGESEFFLCLLCIATWVSGHGIYPSSRCTHN